MTSNTNEVGCFAGLRRCWRTRIQDVHDEFSMRAFNASLDELGCGDGETAGDRELAHCKCCNRIVRAAGVQQCVTCNKSLCEECVMEIPCSFSVALQMCLACQMRVNHVLMMMTARLQQQQQHAAQLEAMREPTTVAVSSASASVSVTATPSLPHCVSDSSFDSLQTMTMTTTMMMMQPGVHYTSEQTDALSAAVPVLPATAASPLHSDRRAVCPATETRT